MAENPNWENDDSLFIKALLCWMHRDSIAFVVETEKEPKIGRLLLQKSFASCVCCTVAIDLPAPRRQFDNVALLPLQLPKVLQSRSLTSQSCPTVLHTLVVQVGEKRKQKKCRHFVVWSLASSSFFFIFYFFFFLRSLVLAIITNRQRESPRQRFDDVYAQLLRWQSNIGDGLGDWVSVGIYLSLKCLCVVFFFLVQSSNFIFFFFDDDELQMVFFLCYFLYSRVCLFILFISLFILQRNSRLHGAGSLVKRHSLRFQRRLVQLRLHAVQTAQRPFAVPSTQDERQARDRPDDVDHGIIPPLHVVYIDIILSFTFIFSLPRL